MAGGGVTPEQVVVLAAAAFFAGTVDAIAGGGGLVTVPALFAAGLPPHLALGTNKGQSVFGSLASLHRFSRAGLVDPARARLTFPLGFAGSILGATLVLLVRPEVLRPVVLVLLVAVGASLVVRRTPPVPHAPLATSRRARLASSAAAALVIGAYDGFFGPGTGTFLIIAFVALLGDGLARASASAKVVNFASNLAAFVVFARRGTIVWAAALPMAAGQLAGGYLGAHLAVRRGDALVRRVVLAVVAALVVKIARDVVTGR